MMDCVRQRATRRRRLKISPQKILSIKERRLSVAAKMAKLENSITLFKKGKQFFSERNSFTQQTDNDNENENRPFFGPYRDGEI